MEEKWRKELKYTVTEGESIVTARRLSSFMQRDKNLKGGREYLIRSLYFDNLYEKVLKEKLSGTAVRDKFRIRYYDFDTAFIRLEKKIIDGNTAWMEEDERPLVRELFLKMKLELFRPSVIVDYCREPFTYAPGNVRITFDRDICSCKDIRAFFRKDAPTVPVLRDGRCIMEVKYDDFLPDVVSRTILTTKNREQAFSKFAACSLNG